ncbi:MAG: FtsX-like permease family protein [Legionellales bacterium]|nr:FtsX-like permease family protein [Legionellales bacterium]
MGRLASSQRMSQPSKRQYYSLFGFLTRHIQAAGFSWRRLWRAPLASLMTIGVIGIALCLPLVLFVLVQNAQMLTTNLDHRGQVNLFLESSLTETELNEIFQALQIDVAVANFHYISPEQGLEDLQRETGLSDILQTLPNNPLPGVIEVTPAPEVIQQDRLQSFSQSLQQLPYVASAKLDMQWLQRLNYIVNVAQQAVNALLVLLSLAVLLIVSNTIRLATQNRRQEIIVCKLIGAHNRFVRRPFLYSGIWYGLLGGLVAWGFVTGLLWWLYAPMQRLVNSYYLEYHFTGLSWTTTLLLIGLSVGLGWLGSLIAVNRQIAAMEPT